MIIVTPQFTRPEGWVKPSAPPSTVDGFNALLSLDATCLMEMGLRVWGVEEDAGGRDLPNGRTLWLYPAEWYSSIPDGYPVCNTFFRTENFKRGVTNDDIRFGCLAFGFCGAPLPKKVEQRNLKQVPQ